MCVFKYLSNIFCTLNINLQRKQITFFYYYYFVLRPVLTASLSLFLINSHFVCIFFFRAESKMTQQIPDPHPLIPHKYSSTSCSSPPSAARRLYRNLSGKFRTASLALDDVALQSQTDKDHSHKTTMVRFKHFNKNYAITETKIVSHNY